MHHGFFCTRSSCLSLGLGHPFAGIHRKLVINALPVVRTAESFEPVTTVGEVTGMTFTVVAICVVMGTTVIARCCISGLRLLPKVFPAGSKPR